ncbi:MAG: hypothetical protein HY535_02375 [Chloroflexi bacterium]|nr:hypothetical protein [Chloroflexota bacterium]
MEFEIARAGLAGLAGTIVMTMVMAMGSMMGMRMDMPMTLGTMVLPRGRAAWVVGLMMHLMMGIVFFIIYAALFSALGIRSAIPGWSALFGAVHALIAGVGFGMMPMLHPRMATESASGADRVPAPGFLGVKLGKMGPIAVVAVHLAYAVVAGAVYAA